MTYLLFGLLDAFERGFIGVILILDTLIYGLISSAFRIFMAIAGARLLSSDAYYANEHPYSGRITVIFYTDSTSGSVKIITIDFGTPKWMNFPEKNGYERTEWVFDFTA